MKTLSIAHCSNKRYSQRIVRKIGKKEYGSGCGCGIQDLQFSFQNLSAARNAVKALRRFKLIQSMFIY